MFFAIPIENGVCIWVCIWFAYGLHMVCIWFAYGAVRVSLLPDPNLPFCATSSLLPLASGRWSLACGLWHLALTSGLWPLASGLWPLASGFPKAMTFSWPALIWSGLVRSGLGNSSDSLFKMSVRPNGNGMRILPQVSGCNQRNSVPNAQMKTLHFTPTS